MSYFSVLGLYSIFSYLIEREVLVVPTKTDGREPASPAVRSKTFQIVGVRSDDANLMFLYGDKSEDIYLAPLKERR